MSEGEGDWRDSLPDDLKTSPALKDIPDVATLAKSHIDNLGYVGRSMRTPKEDWTEDDYKPWAKQIVEKGKGHVILAPNLEDLDQSESFFQSIGKPDSPDSYRVPDDLDLTGIPTDAITKMKNQFHEANLTNAQFEKVMTSLAEDSQAMTHNQQQQVDTALDRLKDEWGQNVEPKIAALTDKLANFLPADTVNRIKAGELGAEIPLAFDRLLSQVKVEGNPVSQDPGGSDIDTPAGLRVQAQEIQATMQALGAVHQDVAKKARFNALAAELFKINKKIQDIS